MKIFSSMCVFLLAILAGCASTYGTKLETSDFSFIQKGKTQRAELMQRLNEPTDRMIDAAGNETLTWRYMKSTTDAAGLVPFVGALIGKQDLETRTLVVFLDKTGLVKDFSLGDDQRTIRLIDNKTVEKK